MNILVPHNWLLEHLDTQAKPEEIAELLSLSGPSVESFGERDGEAVYDIEVTTNRVDAMSIRGIAREAAVILSQAGHQAQLRQLKLSPPPTPPNSKQLPLPKIVNNPELSKRIMCLVLAEVNHAETPDWMARRLLQIDQNIHHAAIDITNYVTHELGHPCHAFDYDKIKQLGGEIIVTEAEAGESLTTLDGETYQTVGGEVVFKNAGGEIIDLPAIKGTANSSVDDDTKTVLLWIESLDPHKVRFASMTHAIRTVAAQLNEKDVDPQLGEAVMLRGIELYQQLCGARVASPLYDDFPVKTEPVSIRVSLGQITTYLGVRLEVAEVASILEQLGFEVVVEPASGRRGAELTVTPPSFRPDVRLTVDVIEEVARIYGYHRLPSQLMATALPVGTASGENFELEHQLISWLATLGWQEVYTYSMVSEQLAAASGLPVDGHLKLANPLTEDRVYLRQTLVPSLQEALEANPQRPELGVFELARTYHPRQGQLPEQTLHLTLARRGEHRQVRGLLEAMADKLHLPEVKLEPVKLDHPEAGLGMYRQVAEITVAGGDESERDRSERGRSERGRSKRGRSERGRSKQSEVEVSTSEHGNGPQTERLGTFGVTHHGLVVLDLLMTRLATVARSHPQYQPIPTNPPLIEDMTFTIPAQRAIGPIVSAIKELDPLIERVELTAQYQRNFTFRITYQNPAAPLSASQVTPVRQAMAERLAADHHAELVGQLQQ